MSLQTGGRAIGATSTRSRSASAASSRALPIGTMPTCSPSGPTRRTSGTRIRSLILGSELMGPPTVDARAVALLRCGAGAGHAKAPLRECARGPRSDRSAPPPERRRRRRGEPSVADRTRRTDTADGSGGRLARLPLAHPRRGAGAGRNDRVSACPPADQKAQPGQRPPGAARASGSPAGPMRRGAGVFYPKGLPHRAELAYVAERLRSLEINGSFYALQTPGQLPDLVRSRRRPDFRLRGQGRRGSSPT